MLAIDFSSKALNSSLATSVGDKHASIEYELFQLVCLENENVSYPSYIQPIRERVKSVSER